MDLRFYHLPHRHWSKRCPAYYCVPWMRTKELWFGLARKNVWHGTTITFGPLTIATLCRTASPTANLRVISRFCCQTMKAPQNKAAFIFWADGFCPASFHSGAGPEHWPLDGDADRLCILFSGQDQDQLAQARQLYKHAVSMPDVTPTYWKQGDRGGWSQAA